MDELFAAAIKRGVQDGSISETPNQPGTPVHANGELVAASIELAPDTVNMPGCLTRITVRVDLNKSHICPEQWALLVAAHYAQFGRQWLDSLCPWGPAVLNHVVHMVRDDDGSADHHTISSAVTHAVMDHLIKAHGIPGPEHITIPR